MFPFFLSEQHIRIFQQQFHNQLIFLKTHSLFFPPNIFKEFAHGSYLLLLILRDIKRPINDKFTFTFLSFVGLNLNWDRLDQFLCHHAVDTLQKDYLLFCFIREVSILHKNMLGHNNRALWGLDDVSLIQSWIPIWIFLDGLGLDKICVVLCCILFLELLFENFRRTLKDAFQSVIFWMWRTSLYFYFFVIVHIFEVI